MSNGKLSQEFRLFIEQIKQNGLMTKNAKKLIWFLITLNTYLF